ncbi:MAG: class I SAM-dependent rRNA methyltransferase [Bacteroides sp.]|nr:class I SAM-dependent rRNA methyltransferase [Prevotella sp.]MCM1408177.1 class I SAM-dependent rRNA methyltransferase [Treponema brennaborense]MCM1469501.1 class I SAM-dependent rRNA methyltransferase [Bacteroides sp.]
MSAIRVFLKAGEEKEIRQGFPWVFDNEIAFVKTPDTEQRVRQMPFADCEAADGSIAEVYSKQGLYLGTGVLNKKSKIAVRILSRERNVCFNKDFFLCRVKAAMAARHLFFRKHDSYRLIFAEADLLPGLIAERFCDVSGQVFLVVQFHALASEIFRTEIIAALCEVCRPAGIFEHSEASVREKEGLAGKTEWIYGKRQPCITIKENGVLMLVDIENGQKTGYFLDQKFNHAAAANLAKGKCVLDACCHTGAFGLHAVSGGAAEVTSVDSSAAAAEIAEKNIALNNAGKVMHVVCADIFDVLRRYEQEQKRFGMIILDPPAFTKSAKSIDKAYSGYKEINLRALKLLETGGILITCSCSYYFSEAMFYGMLGHAASDARRTIQILEKRGAAPDHPFLAGYPRSDYLKCAVIRVL